MAHRRLKKRIINRIKNWAKKRANYLYRLFNDDPTLRNRDGSMKKKPPRRIGFKN